jgi:hypothetical protein
MTEISTLVTSIETLAPYRLSDDLLLDLLSVTVTAEHDPPSPAVWPLYGRIIEPDKLVPHQPPGGYLLENGRAQLTCTRTAGISLGDQIRFRITSSD